jgi:hypothetical protein
MVGATLLPANALLMTKGKAQEATSAGKLTKGDADLLRFAAWAEVVESDLWTQYNELGGATKPNDGLSNVGNPAYMAALQNLDSDMPQYISDNTDDELSHAAFLNAYLQSKGAEPVNLDAFRTLPGSRATGVDTTKNNKRLTNLLNLTVDLSWYTRYRSEENPDSPFNFIFQGPFKIVNEPGIPASDADTPTPATELTQTNKILPEPCDFILEDPALPNCSVIRPTSTAQGGAVATVNAFAADGLFLGHEKDGFLEFSMDLATAADNARREFEED